MHFPADHVLTPAHFASQALPYVLPSQPQTGLYSLVHIQSGIAAPMQFDIFLVQDEKTIIIKTVKTHRTFFMRGNLRVNKITLFI